MVIFGTRPEAIKLAPVIGVLEASQRLEPVVVVTGQHRAMLHEVLETFAIVPDIDLDILQPGQSVTDITVRVLAGLAPWLTAQAPDAVLVQGDTTSTFAGALAAFYEQIPVAHLEAGLRTRDPYRPFPEEMNRRLTTRLTALHLAATPTARAHLLDEGVAGDQIVVTGNTVIDALLWAVQREGTLGPDLEAATADGRRVLLVTAHRRESWGAAMVAIGRAIAEIAVAHPDVLVVAPLHLNPIVRDALIPQVEGLQNVMVVEPLAYGPFCRLMARAHIVLTDSGGIQEEAPSLGKPVLVMRDTTERPEGIATGSALLVGTDTDVIVATVHALLHDDTHYRSMARAVNPYGDGRAAERAVQAVEHMLGVGAPPIEFAAQLP